MILYGIISTRYETCCSSNWKELISNVVKHCGSTETQQTSCSYSRTSEAISVPNLTDSTGADTKRKKKKLPTIIVQEILVHGILIHITWQIKSSKTNVYQFSCRLIDLSCRNNETSSS